MKTIKELQSLKGRRALITGAVGGIGQKIAETIAELGGDLLLVDRPGTDYQELLERINLYWDVEVKCYDCDLEIDEQRADLIERVVDDNSGLSILINNAGFVGTSSLKGWTCEFEQQRVDTWRRAIEVNLTAAFHLSKGLTSKLKRDGNGTIVNIASIYAVAGPDYSLYEGTEMGNPAAYAASKAGLVQLSRWLATTLAPAVRVNTISPGGVFRNQPESFVKRYEEKTPLGRMANSDDFKGIIAYLCSDMSLYTTGQNILVDGGWSIW